MQQTTEHLTHAASRTPVPAIAEGAGVVFRSLDGNIDGHATGTPHLRLCAKPFIVAIDRVYRRGSIFSQTVIDDPDHSSTTKHAVLL